jgi:hypothetical protein
MKMSFERKEIMGTMHVFGGVIFRSDFFGTILKLLLIHFKIFIKHQKGMNFNAALTA